MACDAGADADTMLRILPLAPCPIARDTPRETSACPCAPRIVATTPIPALEPIRNVAVAKILFDAIARCIAGGISRCRLEPIPNSDTEALGGTRMSSFERAHTLTRAHTHVCVSVRVLK